MTEPPDPSGGATPSNPDFDMVIVGAGFAGLAMLHRARELGLSVRVLEAGGDIGGVWNWNRYPGARCDVESADYSYSFSAELEQEWTWSERYATQPEILRYIHYVADRFDLRRDIQLSTRVTGAAYEEAERGWLVRTATGEHLTATFLVLAVGCLSATNVPDIAGLESFDGAVHHTGDWPRDPVDLTGKRVGVIGTGSSGTQIIPEIAECAARLTVFQRTPNFSVPARNAVLSPEQVAAIKAGYPERRLSQRNSASGLTVPADRRSALEVPPDQRTAHYEAQWGRVGFGFVLSFADLLLNQESNDTAADFIRGKIREAVHDERTAEILTPRGYPFGAKRPCVDSRYFETFNRDNVELVDVRTDPIEAVTPSGIKTTRGDHQLDVIVFATGFDAMTGSLLRPEIRGRDGVLLRDKWAAGPQTYLGLATSGFPNMFVLAGPGSPSVLTNVMVSIEQHVDWMGDLLAHMRDHGLRAIEAEPSAERGWVAHVNEAAASTLYPTVDSWYLGAEIPGKPRVFMPYVGGVRRYRRTCAEIAARGYDGFELSR